MPIHSEAGFYQGQRHPCYGVHPQTLGGIDTYFTPWVHDGRVVHWLPPCTVRSQAEEAARRMAAETDIKP